MLVEIIVKVVLVVVVFERKYVNMDLIKVDGKDGGRSKDTEMAEGIIIDKDMSHPQMPK